MSVNGNNSQSWIDDVLSETSHVETPRPWIWWSLVAAISASAGGNYHVRSLKGLLTYTSNIYVILLGESGLGKAFGINLGKLLVQGANTTRVIAGRSSIQAIVTELSKQKTRPDGLPPIVDSRGFIVNGELSSAIIADVDALSILTDLYDGKVNEEWVNSLKLSGKELLKNPYITALFGTAPAGFYDSIPQANIEGGYIGRNLIIYEEKRFQDLDLFGSDEEEEIDRLRDYVVPHYSKHLESLNKQKGRLILSSSAKELYNTWRRKWRQNQQPDKTGFINRVPDHVIKIAMCLCLGRYINGGVIEEADIQLSIDKVTGLIYSNKMNVEGRGLDPAAGQTKFVLNILLRAPGNKIGRKLMLSQGHGNFDSFTLDKIIESLMQLGWVERDMKLSGSQTDWEYTLTGEPLVNYQKWIASQERK